MFSVQLGDDYKNFSHPEHIVLLQTFGLFYLPVRV